VGKLQTGRFERLSARTYSIKGPGALVDLDETVLGVLQLERQAGMEAHLMQEWETFGVRAAESASAGEFTYLLLSNPIGSGRLMVVDGWQRGGSNSTLRMRVMIGGGIPPGFSATTVAKGLDTRIPFSRQPAGRVFSDRTVTASFGTLIQEQATAEWQDNQIVLAPDGSLIWGTIAVNQELAVSLRWAERDAAPFELA